MAGAIFVANWGPLGAKLKRKYPWKMQLLEKKKKFLAPPAEMLSQLEEEEGVL